MRDAVADRLRAECDGEVRASASLADYTTLKVGGPTRILVTVENDRDLAAVGRIAVAEGLPWLVVGRGSNLLVADAGWPGVAILLGRGFRGVEIDAGHVHAGAAEPLPSLGVRLANAGFGGFAWAAAVPGSLGGAVRMNAGAHGGEMSECLLEVELFRLRTQTREVWPVDALGLRYRHSELPDDAVVVAATLLLPQASREQLRAEIEEIRNWRREHQPINEPNCGSVFTNPPGDSAGRLVDQAGGKQVRVGGARISGRHANFIVTEPGATAADVYEVIRRVQRLVHDAAGVDLHPEVIMRGRFEDGGPSW